jgi:sterol desaturase/sphingolipid hydroxylase (fatty acid hydroxylase superfamily)
MNVIEVVFQKIIKGFGFVNIGNSYFFMFLLFTIGLFLLDFWVEGWQESSLRKIMVFKKSTQSDFFLYLLQVFRFFYVFEFVLTLGISYLPSLLSKHLHFQYNLVSLVSNPYISFVLLFFTYDFLRYCFHRLFHHLTFLWALHGYHHTAEEMNIFTYYRHHFFELTCNRFLLVIPTVFLGNRLSNYWLAFFVVEAIELLQHSSIKSDWGFIGKYILISPNLHRIHHSIEDKHYNKNFGSVFVFWDKIFNTYHPKTTITNIGLPNNPYNKAGFVKDMYSVIILFLTSVKKSVGFKSTIKN